MLLMFGLILFTQKKINRSFWLFILICLISGIIVEIIGTKTKMLFGDYSYGDMLGCSIVNVPLIIGINWFIVIYCCGVSMHLLIHKMAERYSSFGEEINPLLKKISVVFDGALLALLFDWLMEPVAIKLGYWKWGGDGSIPLYNYLCWFAVSLLLLFVFNKCQFDKRNKFAVHLLLIQSMFFLLLRTFL
jgi:putative membrane protein